MGEVKYENVFVDGIKIEANVNNALCMGKISEKYWERLNVKIEKELPPIALKYGLEKDVKIEECLEYITTFAVAVKMQWITGKDQSYKGILKRYQSL